MADEADEELVEFLDSGYWKALCPWLHVDGELAGRQVGKEAHFDEEVESALRAHLTHQGFIKLPATQLWGAATGSAAPPAWVERLCSRLSRGILALKEAGHTASCILAYDEVWLLQAMIGDLIGRISGNTHAINDWYVFNVQVTEGGKGWPPHRDRPMGDTDAVTASLRTGDGSAKYTTVWIPLTDATPETSCLYCVPRPLDPGYVVGDPPATSPCDSAIAAAADYQKILALPVPKGSLVAFTHRLLHWGSAPLAPVPGAPPPPARMALSLAFADPSFEPPYLRADVPPTVTAATSAAEAAAATSSTTQSEYGGAGGSFPCHSTRMAVIAAQALAYHHQAPLTAQQARLFLAVFDKHQHVFSDAYAARVLKAGQWARFTTAVTSRRALKSAGAPSQADVDLLFCGFAQSRNGLDASAYI